jgi:hypothetical protein
MTFPEKSSIAMTAILVVVYGAYFATVGRWAATDPAEEIVYQPLLIGAVVVLVILAVISHILLAVASPKQADAFDERDRLITVRAERIGGFVLAVLVLVGLVSAMIEMHQFYIAQFLLLALVLGQLSDEIAKLVLYRRGS